MKKAGAVVVVPAVKKLAAAAKKVAPILKRDAPVYYNNYFYNFADVSLRS